MNPPLLIAGHGTRDDAGVAAFLAFLDRLRRRAGEAAIPTVAGGFIELSPPPLTTAVQELTAAGHHHFVAVPLVLVAAGHAKGDIPAALARERLRQPGVDYVYGRPLGVHPTVLRLLTERLDAALASDAAADGSGPMTRGDTTVLLVGRGSTDPDANAEVTKAARILWEGRGLAGVEPAFISLTGPSVPEGLERCRRLGARNIVVLPYFLFPGVLPDRVVHQTAEYAAAHPELRVRTADVIGDCDGLADVVLERYAEAIAGDIRMNCDTCVYRVALPGFEHRVGAPQQPHDHPEDPAGHHHSHHHGPAHDHTHHDHGHARDQPVAAPVPTARRTAVVTTSSTVPPTESAQRPGAARDLTPHQVTDRQIAPGQPTISTGP